MTEELSNEALFERITMIIDEKIRPLIERDGGKIIFHHVDKGTVFVELSGSCTTCAASHITLKAGVERILRKEIRDVKAVQLYQA
ncbi:MAG: NifU family protein [Bacteroidota bacterium]|nr:NifU family protein [Candidatus Kapabacteria bacterium]MDW8220118.1 NifU family protein [Bacteroidota bacterium]